MELENKERKHKNYKVRDLFIIVVSIVLIIAAAFLGRWVAKSSLFDLAEISVSGNTVVSMDTILEKSGLKTGESLLNISRENAARNILDIPYIKSVDITRSFPGTINIYVTERTPKYVVYYASKYLVIDEEYRCLYESSETNTANWPVPIIELGPIVINKTDPGDYIENEEGLKAATDLIEVLDPYFMENIKRIIAHTDDDLALINQDGLKVYLGTVENLAQKLQNYEELVIKNSNECNAEKLEYIDLRYDAYPVIKRK